MQRLKDQREIFANYAGDKAREQASRCSQCGVPYCQTHCPLHNNILDWLKLTAEGRLEEAYQLSQMTNTFPEICGPICPQDRLCEGNCVIEQSGHGTVTIGAVERYITDAAWENGWEKPIIPGVELAESVGVIGSGPAGLAAADVLRRNGRDIVIAAMMGAEEFGIGTAALVSMGCIMHGQAMPFQHLSGWCVHPA